MDNIRYGIVLLVVVLHAACAYSDYTPWWAVNDRNDTIFNGLLRFLGVFLMPALFFIAGYFALPSLRKRAYSTMGFMGKKLVRLGIPWLIGVFFFCPFRIYLYDYTRSRHFDLWGAFVMNAKSALTFHTGLLTSSYQFSHAHFWFLSLLLFFFCCFAMFHAVRRRFLPASEDSREVRPASGRSILLTFFWTGLTTAVLTFMIHGLFQQSANKQPWLAICNLIQFQPTKVVSYILNFMLGIYAFHKDWFAGGKVPGSLPLWGTLSIILWIAWEKVFALMTFQFTIPLAAAFVLIQPFLYFSILLTLLSFGIEYWHSASPSNRFLAENSYTTYLIHLFFVYVMQLFLLTFVDMDVALKFILVSASAIFLSVCFSHFIFRRFPGCAALGTVILFFLASALTRAAG